MKLGTTILSETALLNYNVIKSIDIMKVLPGYQRYTREQLLDVEQVELYRYPIQTLEWVSWNRLNRLSL